LLKLVEKYPEGKNFLLFMLALIGCCNRLSYVCFLVPPQFILADWLNSR